MREFLKPLSVVGQFLKKINPWHASPVQRSYVDEILVLVALFLTFAFWYQVTPKIGMIDYHITSGKVSGEKEEFPVNFESRTPPEKLFLRFHVYQSSPFIPHMYTMRPDDCLELMVINGKTVPRESLPECKVDQPININLSGYFKKGDNLVFVTVNDGGGREGFSLAVSRTDPLSMSLYILMMLLTLALGLLLAFRSTGYKRALLVIAVLGLMLRLLYMHVTPYDVRSNDGDGHVDYISYIAEKWRIPPIHESWESYQPPVYYVAMSVPYAILRQAEFSKTIAVQAVQLLSVLFSLGILLLAIKMAADLFTDQQKTSRLFWIATLAFFPGFILLAPKVNNDALLQLLITYSALLALRFWKSGRERDWYLLIASVVIGTLTKMNAIPLLAVGYLTLLFQPDLKIKRKLWLGACGVFFFFLGTEWYFLLREAQDAEVGMVGNVGNLNSALIVDSSPKAYYTFNPVQMVLHPFNNAWDDAFRRNFFYEYLYRSAFFGEYDWTAQFKRAAQVLIAFSLPFFFLSLGGVLTAKKEEHRRSLPLLFVFVFVLAAHTYFRFKYPYSASQDFRYSAILLLPVSYYALLALEKIKPAILRNILYGLLIAFIAASAVFMVALTVKNPV